MARIISSMCVERPPEPSRYTQPPVLTTHDEDEDDSTFTESTHDSLIGNTKLLYLVILLH